MKSRAPLLNRSGYLLDSQKLRLLQKDGWLSLPLAEIAELKKPTFASAIVRFTDGKKKSLDLSHLSTEAFSAVIDALKKAVHDHRIASAQSR
jgi:hypothetical protein